MNKGKRGSLVSSFVVERSGGRDQRVWGVGEVGKGFVAGEDDGIEKHSGSRSGLIDMEEGVERVTV